MQSTIVFITIIVFYMQRQMGTHEFLFNMSKALFGWANTTD